MADEHVQNKTDHLYIVAPVIQVILFKHRYDRAWMHAALDFARVKRRSLGKESRMNKMLNTTEYTDAFERMHGL
jgi:hypothetical protein